MHPGIARIAGLAVIASSTRHAQSWHKQVKLTCKNVKVDERAKSR